MDTLAIAEAQRQIKTLAAQLASEGATRGRIILLCQRIVAQADAVLNDYLEYKESAIDPSKIDGARP